MVFFWLFVLGLLTYVLLQRSVSRITRTPVWLLWLVMMLPAFILTGWVIANGPEAPAPTALLLGLFIACPILYWALIQKGRISVPPSAKPEAEATDTKPAIAPPPKPTLRPIDKEEEATLQGCFPWSVYYLQNIEYRPQAMICRGQLRASPTVAYDTVRDNIRRHFGDRFLVLFQEGLKGKPVFALVPNPQVEKGDRSTKTLTRPGLALGLLLVTLFTTTAVGTYLAGVTEDQLQDAPALILQGLPYALGLLIILGCHEMGHYLAARRYGMRVTLPYFIPVPFFLGTLGAFIQMKSPVPNRRALFDVGIAGPLSGLVVAVPLLLWGLSQSTVVPIPEEGSSLLNFEALDPKASLMLTLLSKLVLGTQVAADQAIHLHPIAIAGCLGLVVTALNLMPVGQLDGGHIIHAMYGQRIGGVVGQVARLLVFGLALVHPELMIWAILLFFIPAADQPALNDVSELDDRRDFLGLLALTLLVMIVLPAPGILTRLLY
ncbi:site-2 protease family protein [Nodosilinea sp. LEGE 07298]|uniref:site-2 protease family protein n=1 Tax=Nodosilinea sp. LEGE 07298 TaxID=2777970 RepID=UPI00187EFE5B|nr:site-2 protease family protein [Nodosilinea sp. LEGE 07298]MBE9111803.1 site-2 protease family protein [Nodosilinea sp. LEGE 07298]